MLPLSNNSKLLVVSLPDFRQEEEVFSLIRSHQHKCTRICYLLFRTAFSYIYDDFKKRNLLSNLHIIDLFGRGEIPAEDYANHMSFTSSNIPEILTALDNTIKSSNCNLIIVDTINHLLHYHPRHEIQKLINLLKTEESYKDIKKIFLFSNKDDLVEEESKELFNDLELFADKII
jgi:hypothetical protein